MLSDRDIISWDKRLKDQSDRGFENYVHRRIDLSTARVDQSFMIPGEFIYVEERSSATAVATIKLNRNTNDALDLVKGVTIRTIFTQVYISNAALAEQWIDVIFGINFLYKKKIVSPEEIDAALSFLLGGPITTPAGVDLRIVPGAGGITQIGDAGATSHGLVNNDDLYVSGDAEIDGHLHIGSGLTAWGDIFRLYNASLRFERFPSSWIEYFSMMEELTIPVGQGAAGVATVANMAPADSTIIGCVCRVTQAPGGGATTIDIGRTGGGNLDEFIDGIGTALDTTGTLAANHDAATTGPVLNAAADTLTLTTDANVLVSDMKVRIITFYRTERPPIS